MGTYYKDYSKTLKKIEDTINIKVVKEQTITKVSDIENHLKKDGSVLILYHCKDKDKNNPFEHYIFVDKVIDGKFNIVNTDDYIVEELCNKKVMKGILTNKRFIPPIHEDPIDNVYPKVWFIEKT